MTVRELMTPGPVLTVREDDDLALATQIMLWGRTHHLPVMRGGEVVGVISERDILGGESRRGGAGPETRVREVMSSPAQVIDADADEDEAAERLMAAEIGCLPVVRQGNLIGMVTVSDLLAQRSAIRAAASLGQDGPAVASVMRPDPDTASIDDYLLDAAGRMTDRGVRHLPVIDGDRHVIGVLSDRDVRTAIGDPRRALDEPHVRAEVEAMRVGAAMSTPAVTVSASAPMSQLVRFFIDRRVGALPVVDDDGVLVGIVSYVDLLRALRPVTETIETESQPNA